jgi:acyl transferase domain-containing protein
MEHAGYDLTRGGAAVGVFGGCGINNYLLKYILARGGEFESILDFQAII